MRDDRRHGDDGWPSDGSRILPTASDLARRIDEAQPLHVEPIPVDHTFDGLPLGVDANGTIVFSPPPSAPQQPSPGPWRWERNIYGADVLRAANGATVCGDSSDPHESDACPESPADARLIAAAPELLFELRAACDALDFFRIAVYGTDAQIEGLTHARALLARIEGKE